MLKRVFTSDSSVGWYIKWAYISSEAGVRDQGIIDK